MSTDRAEVARRLPDSALAQAESARRASLLAIRESLAVIDSSRRVRFLQTPVWLTRQTIVVFYPIPPAWSAPRRVAAEPPDTSFDTAVERYRAIAESAGFDFTERRSFRLTIVDNVHGAVYTPLETEGQRGIVLAAPGQPLRVLIGRVPTDTIIGAIAAYLRLIERPPPPKRAA